MSWLKDIIDTNRGVSNAERDRATSWIRDGGHGPADRARTAKDVAAAKANRAEALKGKGRTRTKEKGRK